MRTLRLFITLATAFLFTSASRAVNTDFFIFKATGTITVYQVLPPPPSSFNNVFFTKTFASNDIVNIALGNKLGTKLVDRILAVAMCYDSDRTKSKLVVYDPTAGRIIQDVGTISTLDLEVGETNSGKKGTGFATITLVPTPDGGDKDSAIISGSLTGGAASVMPFDPKTTQQDPNGYAISFKVGNGVGRVNAKYTDAKGNETTVNGVIAKGSISAAGKKLKHLIIDVP